MAVEAATKIHQLVPASPSGADPVAEGAGHLRAIKSAVKGSFPGFGVDTDSGIVTLGADEINALATAAAPETIVDLLFPIGSVYLSAVATNPGTLLGHGTWIAIAQGRFLAGVGTGTDSLAAEKIIAAGNTGGTYNHTLTSAQMPAHTHALHARDDTGSSNNVEGFGQIAGDPAVAGETGGTSSYVTNNGTGTQLVQSTGGGEAHENTPPAFGVYVWQRTA